MTTRADCSTGWRNTFGTSVEIDAMYSPGSISFEIGKMDQTKELFSVVVQGGKQDAGVFS